MKYRVLAFISQRNDTMSFPSDEIRDWCDLYAGRYKWETDWRYYKFDEEGVAMYFWMIWS